MGRKKHANPPHVALIVETSKIYGREILLGIAQYLHVNGPWSIYTAERGQNDPEPDWLAGWKGDGIITRSRDMKFCRQAAERGIPVVSLRNLVDKPDFPTLFPDQSVIVSRIIDHFLERGFQNFAYVGVPGNRGWEKQRREAFLRQLAERGCSNVSVRPTLTEPGLTWEEEQEVIAGWLRTLPAPVGIMVSHDTQGVQLLDSCRRVGVRVPDDIAVVSVDNDPVLCEVATPPLSSLDQNVQKLGYEAAAMLDQMMLGKKIGKQNYFFEPGHVTVRNSSDVLAVGDERLAKSIRFVRENACKGIDVNAIAKAAGMSRRALEKKFVEQVGRTPLEEVQEIRFRRVRQLLLETDYVLPQIAELAGFQYQEYLVRFFKKRTGMTPGEFRRKKRFGSA